MKILIPAVVTFIISGLLYQTSGMEYEQEGEVLVHEQKHTNARQFYQDCIKTKGSEDPAVKYWNEEQASRSPTNAEYMVGNIFYYARGVPQNLDLAHYWLQKSAEQKHEEAIFLLGCIPEDQRKPIEDLEVIAKKYYESCTVSSTLSGIEILDDDTAPSIPSFPSEISLNGEDYFKLAAKYEAGDGVEKNFTMAADNYKKSAALNYPSALTRLGFLHYSGKMAPIVPINYDEAKNLFERSARHPDTHEQLGCAQFGLGLMYLNGKGVDQNDETSIKWFNESVIHKNPVAPKKLEALERKEDARKKGAEAYFTTGMDCYVGTIKKDLTSAKRYFTEAKKRGHPKAETMLSKIRSEQSIFNIKSLG